MGTYDVAIPSGTKPIFPLLCVACEKESPDSSMELTILGANTGSLAENAIDLVAGTTTGSPASSNTSNRIRDIPICTGCEARLKWYHRLLKFATYTIWLPAILIMLAMPGPLWLRIVIFVVIIVSPPILSMIFPPAFGATFLNGQASFEFRSKQIADAFQRVNGHIGS